MINLLLVAFYDILEKTKSDFTLWFQVTDITHRIITLKWQWAGYIRHRIDNYWDKQVLEWRQGLSKRSVGCPQARWSDDLRRTAGRSWVGIAHIGRSSEMAYVQQCTVVG
jgi:hypothetical protein